MLLTECSKCSDQMRNNIVAVVRTLQRDYPREWGQLIRHYDPDGNHRRRYVQYLDHREEGNYKENNFKGNKRGAAPAA